MAKEVDGKIINVKSTTTRILNRAGLNVPIELLNIHEALNDREAGRITDYYISADIAYKHRTNGSVLELGKRKLKSDF